MCDQLATSIEHIPPRCIFPEKKDLPNGIDLRKNLMTVPSCDEHNSQKSGDDEYLLYILSMVFQSNKVGMHHYFTKIRRAIKRNPSVLKRIANTAVPVNVKNFENGIVSKSYAINVEEDRFNGIIDKMARAIYYYHFNEKWLSLVRYQAEFLIATIDPKKVKELNDPLQDITMKANGWFANSPILGENPTVFKYQVLEGNHSKLMRLHFYEGCRILLIFNGE